MMSAFKSRWGWICAVFGGCAAVFLGIAVYQAKQPPEIIKVYEVVKPVRNVTPQSSEGTSLSGTPAPETGAKGAFDEPADSDFLDDTSDPMDEDPHLSDDDFVDELLPPEVVEAETDDLPTDSATQAEAAYAAQRVADLRIEIPQQLQERIDLMDLLDDKELAEFAREDEEIYSLMRQIFEDTVKLRQTIFDLSHEYIRYSDGDLSPFQPGGEFYDLFVQNHLGIVSAD